MIVLAGLLALAAGCLLGAPRLLRLRRTALRRPRLLLAAWLGVFLLGAAAIVGSVLWSVTLAVAAHTAPVDAGWFAGLLAWGALATTGATGALVLARAEPLLAGREAAGRDLDLLAAACTERVGRVGAVPVLFVRAERPIAFSSTGDGGRIVVTSALADALSPGSCAPCWSTSAPTSPPTTARCCGSRGSTGRACPCCSGRGRSTRRSTCSSSSRPTTRRRASAGPPPSRARCAARRRSSRTSGPASGPSACRPRRRPLPTRARTVRQGLLYKL